MKKSGAFFVCLLLTLLCCAPIARAQDTLRLKAITYNLRFGELASLEELAARIASEKPDMVALPGKWTAILAGRESRISTARISLRSWASVPGCFHCTARRSLLPEAGTGSGC